jgi:ankyrin repeat protein
MEFSIKQLIDNKDYEGLRYALSQNPQLANEGIPYDEVNTTKAPPLHRICDWVFSEKYTDEEAVKMAKILLDYGANIDGDKLSEKQDTPLIAAASLHADQVAILYIEKGANLTHAGCHGGTALHWAAWCGRDKVVRRLVQAGAAINKRCIDFKATPLFWAVHGLKSGDKNDRHNYLECVRLLIQAGADKSIPNGEGKTVFDLLNKEDAEFKELLC